jgi:putative oxidoreductase
MNSIFLVPPIVISLTLLLIRIIIAVSFFFSALHKAKNPRQSAKQNGLPLPLLLFVMCAEFAGAAGLITGILGQYAAVGLMLLMVGTISLHVFVWRSKYWASEGGWEYDLMLFSLCAVIALFGIGSVAI